MELLHGMWDRQTYLAFELYEEMTSNYVPTFYFRKS